MTETAIAAETETGSLARLMTFVAMTHERGRKRGEEFGAPPPGGGAVPEGHTQRAVLSATLTPASAAECARVTAKVQRLLGTAPQKNL